MKRVMVFGTFDMLHKGHLYFLNEAKKHGDYLIVVVARDSNVKKIKNKSPVNDENSRMSAIVKTGIASEVVLGDKTVSFRQIFDWNPDVICLGYDQNSLSAETHFPEISFVRIAPFEPETYKTSKMRRYVS